jgi:hypothetical protein
MLACILFVFAALAEYAALLYHRSRVVLRGPPPAATLTHSYKAKTSILHVSDSSLYLLYQMELQTFFEMENIDVSEFEYHVVYSVPDFQTKLSDSRPARLALICRFFMIIITILVITILVIHDQQGGEHSLLTEI